MGSKDKLQLLKKLQKARASKSSKDLYDDDLEDESKVYDLIDENQYREKKRQEMLHDDFVVDDDGLGYVDRGVDEWDDRYHNDYYSDEEDDGKHAKGKKQKNQASGETKKSIGEMISAQHSKNLFVPQKKPKKIDASGFEDILDEFGIDQPSTGTSKTSLFSKKTKEVRSQVTLSENPFKRTSSTKTPSHTKRLKIDDASFDIPHDNDASSAGSSPLKFKKKQELNSDIPSDPVDNHELKEMAKDVESSPTMIRPHTTMREEENDGDDSDDEIQFGRRTIRSVATNRQMNFNSRNNLPSSPFVTAPGTPNTGASSSPLKQEDITNTSSLLGRQFTKDQVVDENTGSFRMYWLDFCEFDNTLLLFGKIRTRSGQLISGMVQVKGFCRELFFLPREGKVAADVHQEIIPLLMEKYGLDNIRSKPETKKYAFELPNIPHETEYLKVLLPYQTSKSKNVTIPAELEGDTFCHVFGGNTNIFESFVVQRKVMGPCWLEIKNGDFDQLKGASHCAVDVLVSKPENVVPIADKMVPDLNCISVSVQTVMNPRENKQEIVSITIANYKNLPQDAPIPEDLAPNEIMTVVRPPQGSSFPTGLSALSKKELRGQVRLFNNEKALLNYFCAMMKVNDPDVIIGHRLENVALDVLAHRAFELKVSTFSTLGRRVRKNWPEKFGKNNSNMSQFYIREIFSGRLLCDISNEMGQSLTTKCQSWELSEMYQVTCQKDHKPLEINFQNPQYQNDVNSMVLALQENISNSLITAEVAFRIQILSLTKQLTTLAGNAWCQTLAGTRAGRNEYILLHEFARSNFIAPDKETRQMRNQREQKMREEIDGEHAGPNEHQPVSSKKAKYQGGLVFEPEKGLHKNYVLVMDFNSLYPSIIQEFNICFTTVERDPYNIDELPQVPSSDKDQGVLPRLLANLVQRRREVKKLMKSETDPHKKTQCDIRQQALKLTANSMYGCLGYVNSRFYAKPLAMLVTNKGREILMNTRQLAESLALTVVYGDTDSVMIDTGCDNYAEAIKIGENFKKMVNERYKLLEIDIDNVFKKLLLHAKKKYAALNVSFDKNGKEQSVLEVKGLDMKRREYCPLSKEVSINVLNVILSDKDSETALQEVYAYMEETRSKIENNEIRVDKYKINTKLSKDPKAYPGGKNMPAVQVALRMREAGRVVKAGSVITFVITKQDHSDEREEALSPAERARALNEVMVKNNNLRPDPQYYLEKQIFAPVERLLERIESFDIVRLSESLGLDSKRFINRIGANGELNGNGIDTLQPLESTISDMERFKDAATLELQCPSCQNKFPFGGIVSSNHYHVGYNGIHCKKCEHLFTPLQMSCQLERSIRSHISLYYAGWLQCDDSTCGTITRQISVFGKRCLNESCTGVMRYRYTDKQLYNQLLYFDSIFDSDKNKKQELKPLYHSDSPDAPAVKLSTSQVLALSEQNRELFDINRQVVQKYLSDCGRRYVDMGSIFDFML